MGPVLSRAAAVCCSRRHSLRRPRRRAQSDRHEFYFDASAGYVSASTDLGKWTDGGVGKLRYGDDGLTAFRLFGEYHGRITPTLRARVVADYRRRRVGRLRPDRGRHRLAAGSALAQSASRCASARSIRRSRSRTATAAGRARSRTRTRRSTRGSARRFGRSAPNGRCAAASRASVARTRCARSPPASTATIPRARCCSGAAGRCTTASRDSNDELLIPPRPFTTRPQNLSPFMETDHRPGGYAGVEWRYAQRALVQFARYDNRADPYSFSDGQWGWGTDFNHLAVQVSLPAELGLVFQWMDGTTEWLTAALPNGTRLPMSEYVQDDFESQFVMLTRKIGAKQRFAVRYDTFSIGAARGRARALLRRRPRVDAELSHRGRGAFQRRHRVAAHRLEPRSLAVVLQHRAPSDRRPAQAAALVPPRRSVGALVASPRPPASLAARVARPQDGRNG